MNFSQLLSTLSLDFCNLLWLGCGLFIAGVLEVFLWKTSLFEPLNIPIHTALFGANKKWRGLVSLPLAHTASVVLFQFLEKPLMSFSQEMIWFSSLNTLEYGLLVGFVFNLSELPNSFIKRRLNIPPGDESNPLFYIADHIDSTYGTLILWYFYFKFPWHLVATGFLAAPLLFMAATWLRKKLGLK